MSRACAASPLAEPPSSGLRGFAGRSGFVEAQAEMTRAARRQRGRSALFTLMRISSSRRRIREAAQNVTPGRRSELAAEHRDEGARAVIADLESHARHAPAF